MRYFGSKGSVLLQLQSSISSRVSSGSFCDPFGGVGVVGSYFKAQGYSVWCGDVLTFAYHFQVARIEQEGHQPFRRLCQMLGLEGPDQLSSLLNAYTQTNGWFIEQYSRKRHFFTLANAQHIQACWELIRGWESNSWIGPTEYAVLSASLINSMDKVANTAGTYYAYLKEWHRKAKLPFRFELLVGTPGLYGGHAALADANCLVGERAYDVLYLDPPYNQRSYAHYYHLPETIALGQTPEIHGRSGIPKAVSLLSEFNRPSKAAKALAALLERARFRLLAFHYADNGLISMEEIRETLASFGSVEEVILKSKNYTVSSTSRTADHRLYLVTQ